jgi:quercetin dioxygenase-like cupin family protein
MQGHVRRVVTGHDADGRAIVLEDRPCPAVHTNPHRPGHISCDLWKTSASPVPLKAEEPEPTAGPKVLHPPRNGTVFRISEVPPETEATRELTPEKAKAAFEAMGAGNASTFGKNQRHPFMHRTETVDYAVVLDGEIVMLVDEGEVHLKAGDVVIQRGTNHAWSNRSGKPVRMLYVLVDGQFDPALKAKFG